MGAPIMEETIATDPRPDSSDLHNPDSITPSDEKNDAIEAQKHNRGFRFWSIMIGLSVVSLLGSLENTVISTSLPTMVKVLNLGPNYVWISNVFFLTSAAVQPLFGQLANIFGRRWLAMFIVAIFTLGSGICGGATNGNMLIAGRAIQGIGSGGINLIGDIIISDLVPLRERGNYVAILLTVYAVGASLGPFVGGMIVERTTWRWVFYLNLPIGGAAMILLYLSLHVNYNKEMTFAQKIRRIDFIGNLCLMLSSLSVLFALTYGGSKYSWSSYHVLVPLILGLLGFVVLPFYEKSKYCIEPVIPPRLFQHRTAVIVAICTFLDSALLFWVFFFLPVFFQAILLSSPARAGVQTLPMTLVAIPGAAVAVIVLARWGKYRILHQLGFALFTLGLGLFGLQDRHTSIAELVIYQIIPSLGAGMVLNTLLPAFQAELDERDQAAATATWSFIRSFGNIWGFAIAAAIFNSQVGALSYRISDPSVRQLLAGGHAYEHATRDFVNSYEGQVKDEIMDVLTRALKMVWYIAVIFSGIAFFLTLGEKQIKLRTQLETEYGLTEELKKEKDDIKERNIAPQEI